MFITCASRDHTIKIRELSEVNFFFSSSFLGSNSVTVHLQKGLLAVTQGPDLMFIDLK